MRAIGFFDVLLVALAASSAIGEQAGAACNLMCVKGQKCVLQQVQCIAAPCDPVPMCVPVDPTPAPMPTCTKKCRKTEKCQIDSADGSQYCLSPCATVRCASGYTCQVEQVQCIKAPCDPVAVCNPIKKVNSPYGTRVLRPSTRM